MKYAKLIDFHPIEDVIQLKSADDAAIGRSYVESYVVSDAMAENLANAMINQLQLDEVIDNKGVLVVGNYGTGKSHLMSVVSAIASDADNLPLLKNKKLADEMTSIVGRFEILRIEIGGVTMSLREILLGFIEDDFKERGISFSVPNLDKVRDNKKLIRDVMLAFSEKYPDKGYLIVVDEFLSYLTSRDTQQIVLDLEFYNDVYDHIENIVQKPDQELLAWNNMECDLFRRIEEVQYGDVIRSGFDSMQDFIDTANSVINRRKIRAGKSLEYHLEAIFQGNRLTYEPQVVTEEKKRPDFVFPGTSAYHNPKYPADKLVVLGGKTIYKDRWRQVITEADRVKTKYLCTLQQGISPKQLHEMKTENVVLVLPQPFINTYPKEYREDIFTLAKFIQLVQEKTAV